MSTVLHLSDPHFGTDQSPVEEALLQLAGTQQPDLLILSGDVTQRARRHQFDRAAAFLQRLGIANTIVLPGNHDIPLFNVFARAFTPYGNYMRAFDDLEPEYESEDLLAVGVNTTRPGRHTVGTISPKQIDRISRRLRHAAPEQLRIVVTHQPVHVIRPSDEKNILRGHLDAVQAWASAGADLILGGHIHLPYVRPLKEILPDLPRPLWAVQAGTSLSWRIRSSIPNSVNIIRYLASDTPRHCVVDRWDYDHERGSFARTDQHVLHLGDTFTAR
ncbi:metallophosphoesterase [Geomonas sp. RF6]|uniref:metallophosphoesterase family protein n=1 Tax=Geomonas sp. RF6 TaxID=2897342 RepID=UPI001E329323|nr:metallophosphoesterase [Geomonas sp. RF6]UFS71699.1 metallophosphoesterase [Geomonas sp. RF6]